jgi:hypothetical protein
VIYLGGMRFPTLLLAAVAWTAPLAAQSALRLSAGATYSSALIDDGVLSTKLRPAIAPTVGLGIAIPTGKGPYRVVAEVSYARSALKVISTTGTGDNDQLAAVATVTALILAEGALRGAFRWQVGGGAVFYRPTERQGVFQIGGRRRWMLAGGVVWRHPLTATMDLLVTGRVDAHAFSTDVLQARGYGESQSVQRFGLLLGVSRRL